MTEEGKLIAVRLEAKHLRKLAQLMAATGWNQSEVVRRLIEDSKVAPAKVSVSVLEGSPKEIAPAYA